MCTLGTLNRVQELLPVCHSSDSRGGVGVEAGGRRELMEASDWARHSQNLNHSSGQNNTMDLEAHSYEVRMKPYIHNFTWHLFELHEKLLLTSYALHTKFIWTSHEFHIKLNRIYSYEIHERFIWTSYGVQTNFSWNSYEMKWNLLIWIYMQFVWSSYRMTNGVNLLYPCNTNEFDMRLINISHEIHVKSKWISNDLNFMWTS